MSERYSRLFTLSPNLYTEGSPAIITAGALLKDSKTEKVLVQLKIRNIKNTVIKAAKVSIQPLDTVDSKLGDKFVYTYLDLLVQRDEEFGQKTLIPVPDNESRGFEVCLTEVAFEDNSVWKEDGSKWGSLPMPESINECLSSELVEQYQVKYGKNSTARPRKEKDLWYCACGALNHEGEFCHVCGKTYAELTKTEWKILKTELEEKAEICRKDKVYASGIAKMTGENISNYKNAIRMFQTILGWRDSDEQICACQKKIDEIKANQEAKSKKFKKIITIAASTVAVGIGFTIALTEVIIPNSNYRSALELYNTGKYDEAIATLTALDGFKDSAEQIEKCETAINVEKYNTALQLLDVGNYDAAYALLQETGHREDVYTSKYDRALKLLDSGDYEVAYSLLEETNNTEIILSNKYDRALKSLDSGDYEVACSLLRGISYKDSDEKYNTAKFLHEVSLLSKAKIGSTVLLGAYEQDNNLDNGAEDIEWQVIAKEGNKILVISKYGLDTQPYNATSIDVTWETCTVRKWLNGTFLKNAFSDAEQTLIESTNISADKNPQYSTNSGNSTKDKIFFLSIPEAEKYFSSDEGRKCVPTEYAIAQGAYTADYETKCGVATCWWYLRSPGKYQVYSSGVDNSGHVCSVGYNVNGEDDLCVRPTFWINFDK